MSRRPPQTMADIPFAVRKAAVEYVEHLAHMMSSPARADQWGSAWHEMDLERRRLHDRFIDEIGKIGLTLRMRADAERIADNIAKRRWRAKKSVSLKARRPPQTMADIPFAVRKAAHDYQWFLDSMQDAYTGQGNEEDFWEDMDTERRKLHNRFLRAIEKIGLRWTTRGDSERIAEEIDQRRWRARKSAGLKARRPPQTMADLPFAVRKAAQNYIEHINRLIRFPPSRGSPLWGERGRLHDKLLRELEKLGIRYGTRAEAEQIAKDIVKRRWRAKKSAGRDRLVDRIATRLALKLVGWKSTNLVLTFRMAVAFDSLRRHVRDLEWAGARVTGSRMLWGLRDVGEIRVTVRDVAAFVRRFKRTRASDYWRERW